MIEFRYAHQLKTLEFIQSRPATLVTSAAGTGKTISAIDAMAGKGKCLVVCPAFLTRNWKAEVLKFTDEEAGIWPDVSHRITIYSVDSIWQDAKPFHDLDVLVVDECHTVLTITSRRTTALHKYVKEFKPKKFIGMTATPMRNRIPELYSLLLLLDYYWEQGFQKLYASPWTFNLHFTHKVTKRFGGREVTSWEGAKNVDDLKKWLKDKFIKFTLEELHDLPSVMHEEVIVDCKVDEANELELETGWTEMQLGAPPSSSIATAKMNSAIEKVPFAIEYLKNLLAADCGPLVVFTDHVDPCSLIQMEITGAELIRGDTPMWKRDMLIQKFQLGQIPLLVCTIGAASTGITLTKSNTLIFLDKSFVPANNYQAMHRIYRVSQTRKCRIIHLVKPGIDTRISRSLQEKEKLIGAVLE